MWVMQLWVYRSIPVMLSKYTKRNSKRTKRSSGTSIRVRLRAVAVLQPVGPRALVLGAGHGGLPDAVAALEALRPLAAVQPPPARLHAQPVALPVLPVALVVAPAEIEGKLSLIKEERYKLPTNELMTDN